MSAGTIYQDTPQRSLSQPRVFASGAADRPKNGRCQAAAVQVAGAAAGVSAGGHRHPGMHKAAPFG
ncbi:hypothetical protein B841_08070 [Corynebacterium maris DSM 45190]|uniref:Uncharacterized protein n=1 Tax=Corynebacterium maris DSM 45190 TaxID=1224163 RepID=S5SVM0_9CORY|nr:hypothetical protein B841_08070 [Corynebacterium maris DSM 45190]